MPIRKPYTCFLIYRTTHEPKSELKNITVLGGLEDYSIIKPWQNSKGKQLLNNAIFKYKIDLVHIYYAEPNLLWVKALPPDLPVVLTTRGSDVLIGLKHFVNNTAFVGKMVTKAYQSALLSINAITSTSWQQVDFLKTNFTINCPLEIVRTGLDISKLRPPQPDKKLVFFSRNMYPLYNHELALNAISRLPAEIKNLYHFLFIDKNSKDQAYVARIDNLIQALNCPNIAFKNALTPDAYFDTLAQSKLVVMTPESDGAPVSGMEAIAAGAKLILPELNYDKDLFSQAVFYEPGNVKSLTASILTALKDQTSVDIQSYLPKVDRNAEMGKVEALYKELKP